MEILQSDRVIGDLTLPFLRELSTFGAMSDAAVTNLMTKGTVKSLHKGEVLSSYDMPVTGFAIVLKGDIVFYKHCQDKDVLTRHFRNGEQIGFDDMIAMHPNSGTEIAYDDSWVLLVSNTQFFKLYQEFPADFGLFMINLSRELSREIVMLEEVIAKSTGWQIEYPSA